jgi:hypothetical protein
VKLSTERVENHSTNLSDIDTRALEAAKHLHGIFLNDNLNGGDTQRLAAVQLFIADVIRETEAEYQISTRTSGKSDDLGLVARIRYRVNNPSAWDSFDQAASDDFASAAAAIERLVAENRALREAMTPSADTKAAYIGEFSFNVEVWDPDGGEDGEGEAVLESKTVPWTTVKEIMAAISAHARQALKDTP